MKWIDTIRFEYKLKYNIINEFMIMNKYDIYIFY